VANVDRGTKESYRAFDDFDGTIYSGAKTARVGEQDFH
jgi:hypothetical protein